MKKHLILFSTFVTISLYGISQDTANVVISENTLVSPIFKEGIANDQIETNKKPKDSVLLKLQIIENMIKNLKQNLIDTLTTSLKSLPNMVNQEHFDEVNRLNNEILSLKNVNGSIEAEKNKLILEKLNAESKLNTQKNEYEKEISALKTEKAKAESEKNSATASKVLEWEAYTRSYFKNEKFISDDLYNKLKIQVSTNSFLKSDLDSFQIQSKRLTATEDFLFAGKGDFKSVYKAFKNKIDNTKYPKQANSQKELQPMFDLFLIFADGLYEKLEVIKGSNTEALRTDELKKWRYHDLAINFPYLRDIIQKNYKKHTPLNFDPKNP